jgi:hypothetical protein
MPPLEGSTPRRPACAAGGAWRRLHHDNAIHTESGGYRFIRSNNADAGCRHAAIPNELRHDAVDDIDRNGETDPRIGAGR